MDPFLALIDTRFRQMHTPVLAAFAVVSIGLVSVLDSTTGPETATEFLYLLPVGFVAYFASVWVTRVVCVIAAGGWLAAELSRVSGADATWFPYWNAYTRLLVFLVVAGGVRIIRTKIDREEGLARTDPLTGILNSRAFSERVEEERMRLRRYRRTFSVIYFDLDHFKQVNDTLGHAAGDEVLRTIATAVQASVRDTDFVARMGGDEFAVLLPETDIDEVNGMASRVLDAVRHGAVDSGVTATMGLVTVHSPAADADVIVAAADRLMYAAKDTGWGALQVRVIDDADLVAALA